MTQSQNEIQLTRQLITRSVKRNSKESPHHTSCCACASINNKSSVEQPNRVVKWTYLKHLYSCQVEMVSRQNELSACRQDNFRFRSSRKTHSSLETESEMSRDLLQVCELEPHTHTSCRHTSQQGRSLQLSISISIRVETRLDQLLMRLGNSLI